MPLLTDDEVEQLRADGELRMDPFPEDEDPVASYDIGPVEGSPIYRPPHRYNAATEDLTENQIGVFDDSMRLEPGMLYLFEGPEVSLPEDVVGKGDPRSTYGRSGTTPHILTDREDGRLDYLPPGYEGKTYIAMTSRAFPLRIEPGVQPTQLRLVQGAEGFLSRETLEFAYGDDIVLYDHTGNPLSEKEVIEDNATALSVNTDLAWVARETPQALDMSARGEVDIAEFFDVWLNPDDTLMPVPEDTLMLLSTKEQVHLNGKVAGKIEMKPESLGADVETHHAGFVDPGWRGFLTLEFFMLPGGNPVAIGDGQHASFMQYERTSTQPEKDYNDVGNYQDQPPLPIPAQTGDAYNDPETLFDQIRSGKFDSKVIGDMDVETAIEHVREQALNWEPPDPVA